MSEYFIFSKEDLEILRDGELLYEYEDKVPNRWQEKENLHFNSLEVCLEHEENEETEE